MSAYKIFISSPGDVGRERHVAEQVIRRVAAEFQDRTELQPYFWEYEPMDSTRDYQENIPLTSDFDMVICILWKRLGSPLSVKHERPGGGRWRSGTEFELVTAVESKRARGVPDIFIFKNDTKATFEDDDDTDDSSLDEQISQRRAVKRFLREWCQEEQGGQKVFTAALNRYQTLDQFELILEKLLHGKLDERFPPASNFSGSELRDLRARAPTWTEGSPFRGLEAFQFPHAPVFCGRTHAIGEILDRLRRKAAQGRPFVLILGASGSGKSSLAMAGVLPLLVKPGTIEGVGLWRRVVFRPGGQTEVGDLFDRLASALVRAQHEGEGLPELISGSTSIDQIASDLRADPKAAALLVRSALNQAAAIHCEAEIQKLRTWIAESQAENRMADVERYGRLLAELTPRRACLALVIDQAEELFTSDDLNYRPELRKAFAVALDALAASGAVFVLATLRNDFYSQIQQLPAFVDLKEADGQFDLLPAEPAEVAQMIRQPAIAAGLKFQKDPQTQEGLDEVLADQVKAEPRLLPLLEFALAELYKQRTSDGLLTFEAYRVHLDGSIVRALAKRADATLESLPELARDAFRSVMRRLATTADVRAAESTKGAQVDVIEKGSSGPGFQRQRVPYDQLTAHPLGAKALVDAFVAARLLVVETGDGQKGEVTVAHEALFVHWTALKNLLLAERDDLILPRARVAASYERWRAENQAGDFLLPRGKQLSEAEQLLAEYSEELTPELKAYVAASMAQANAQQKRRQRLLVGALLVFALLAVGATAAAVFGFWQNAEAQRQARLATEEQQSAEKQATAARAAEKRTSEVASQANVSLAHYSTAAGNDAQALAHLAQALRLNLRNYEAGALVGMMLTQTNWLFPTISLMPSDSALAFAQFSLDGHQIVVVYKNAIARLWDARNGKQIGQPMRHEDSINTAQFSPDGRQIVTASNDGTARLWDATTGKQIGEPMKHEDAVNSAQFSPDGERLVTASNDGTARLWSAQNGKQAAESMKHEDRVNSAQFSPDGRQIVTASNDRTVRLWDALSGKQTAEPMKHEDRVNSAQFSPDSRRLLTACENGTAHLWDAQSDKQVGEPMKHGDLINSAQFSPDGQRIVTASGDRTACLWDALTGKRLAEPMKHKDRVNSAQFSPDGQWIVTASNDGTARLWDALTGEEVAQPMKHKDRVNSAQYSPDGQLIMTASQDGTAWLWSALNGKEINEPIKPECEIGFVQFSPDGKLIVTGCKYGTAQLWDTLTFKKLGEVREPFEEVSEASSAQFSPDGQRLVTAWSNGVAQLRDVLSSEQIGELMRHEDRVNSAQFSPDGQRIVTASNDGTARLWDARNGKQIGEPMRHEEAVNSAQFSPDCKRIVTASNDGTARLWAVPNCKQIGESMRHEEAVNSAQFSPDGQQVVTASEDKTARLWDATTGKAIRGPMKHEGGITSAQFSPDGQRVVTASKDKTAGLWDAVTGQPIGKQMRQENEVTSAQFSPDGQLVVTASLDQTARLWDAHSGERIGEPVWHRDQVNSAQFSRDGRQLLTASNDETAQVWDILQISSKDTSEDILLLADLAEMTSGIDLQSSGQAEGQHLLTIEQIGALREKITARLRPPYATLTPLQHFLKWSVSQRGTRTISPFSKVTVPEWVGNRINEARLANLRDEQNGEPLDLAMNSPRRLRLNRIDEEILDGLRVAMQLDPTNGRLAECFGQRLVRKARKQGTNSAEARRAPLEAHFQLLRALKLDSIKLYKGPQALEPDRTRAADGGSGHL
jgi:WD40 repeat protein